MKLASTLKAVTWFFQVLVDESLAFAIQHWGFAEDPSLLCALQRMSTAMSDILELLKLAQSIQWENKGVHEYLKNLKDAAYTADDLLSELDYYRLHQQVEASEIDSVMKESASRSFSHLLLTNEENHASTSSPSQYPSLEDNRSNLVPRMNENVRRLRTLTAASSSVLGLLKQVEDWQPNPHYSPVASHRMTTSFSASKQTVIGRDSERDQVIQLLLSPTPTSVSMIPIVGMGGIGKTTLAKMAYNHEEIRKHFDCRIWVCVSNDFDVARLTREILEYLGVDSFDHTTNFNTLQELLMERLQYVRYLLVLDDVWDDSEEKWESLCAPLRSQKGGSRILMTTRLNTVVSVVAKDMDMLDQCQLEGLPEEKYLPLFERCAFGDENPRDHPSLLEIGRQIAGKLKGSPLAAKTMGGLLRENLDEDHWRSVLYSDIWRLPQSHHDITPVLQLSYQHLPPHLQQCFVYCNLFPKDSEFEKDELVGMWISHGYVHAKSEGNKSVEEIGGEYFDNLLSRSFIHASTWEIRYVLHDLFHDLAESVSDNEYHKINLQETNEITSSVRHLYVHSNNLGLLKSCNLRNLRTLFIHGDISVDYNVLKEVLHGLKNIRVLSLSVSVEHLSGSIGHLIHLRYLYIEYTDRCMSPDSRCRPYHLKWLISEGKDHLVLPAATKYLVSLRHIHLRKDFSDWCLEIASMSGIGKMTCLQELVYFRVGKNEGRKLAELKRLNELGGTLRLGCLDNASTKEEALEANLNKKVGIRILTLDCGGDGHRSPQIAEEVFEGLCPPPYIENLTLNAYRGVKSPTWMVTENNCLSFLQSLTLSNCWKLKVLPPLGQLPSLGYLKIYGADAVEEIGSSFYGAGVAKSFPCLETLEFKNMPEWVAWSGVKEDTDSLFPRLCKLTLMGCPKLKRVPTQCLASVEVLKTNCMVLLAELENLASLKKLIIKKCKKISLFNTETETKLPSLQELVIKQCDQLVSTELRSLPSLKKLRINSCNRIQSVPLLPATRAELDIEDLPMLTAFSRENEKNLSEHTSLRNMSIKFCDDLQSLPLMPASLQELYIQDCSELQRERYQEGGDNWHKISHVCSITWFNLS